MFNRVDRFLYCVNMSWVGRFVRRRWVTLWAKHNYLRPYILSWIPLKPWIVWFWPALMMMKILFHFVIRAVIYLMSKINGHGAFILKDPVSTSWGMKYFAINWFLCCVNMFVGKYVPIWLSNTVKTPVLFISFVKFVPILIFFRISQILSYNPNNTLKWSRPVINASARNGGIKVWGCGLLPLCSDGKYSFNIKMINWEDVVAQL